MTLEQKLDRLEKRITRLEYREGRVRELVRPNERVLANFILEQDLDPEQLKGIFSVLEEVHDVLTIGTDRQLKRFGLLLNEIFFEKRLLAFVPEKSQSGIIQGFVKSLLMVLGSTGQYPAVFDHFQWIYNVPTRDQLREQ